MTFERDPSHWLLKFSPDEWIRAAMADLRRAEAAYKQRDGKGGLAGCRRAAGMALNGALVLRPKERWGRTYVEHVVALQTEEDAPEAVRQAARTLMSAQPPGADLLSLRTPRSDERILEATRDIIAHAYAIVVKHG